MISCPVWDLDPIIVAGNGGSGNGASQLNGPTGIAFDRLGNMYIADGWNFRIQKYLSGSTSGITIAGATIGGTPKFNFTAGLYIDIEDNLYVIDYFNCRILKYVNISIISTSPPIIGQVVAGGTCGSDYNQLSNPTYMTVDYLGNLYVSDAGNNRVMMWPPGASNGSLVASILYGTFNNGSSSFGCPNAIYVDTNRTLFIADYCNNQIQKWPTGSSIGITVLNINSPSDLFVDSYDMMYVASGNGIFRYFMNSDTIERIVTTAESTFNFNFDRNRNLYVVDDYNNDIKRYNVISTNCGKFSKVNYKRSKQSLDQKYDKFSN